MNIKRVKHCLYYREAKITEYALLTEFSPQFINSKIKGIKLQIEAMYYLNIYAFSLAFSSSICITSFSNGYDTDTKPNTSLEDEICTINGI
jgi:hypothetical protein